MPIANRVSLFLVLEHVTRSLVEEHSGQLVEHVHCSTTCLIVRLT